MHIKCTLNSGGKVEKKCSAKKWKPYEERGGPKGAVPGPTSFQILIILQTITVPRTDYMVKYEPLFMHT